jgi:glutamine cyclotransferase
MPGLGIADKAHTSAGHVKPKVLSWTKTNEFPHDPTAFTQGFEVWDKQYFLESTGQYGKSEVRKVERASGLVKSRTSLDKSYFGEGITRVGAEFFQLTWREGLILRWAFSDKLGFDLKSTSFWVGEGWGITAGSGSLWVSNGSSDLIEVNQKTLKPKRTIKVTLEGRPFDRLNELEWVEGKIMANVYMSSTVVVIDPKTGIIGALIDVSGLVPRGLSIEAVPNGLAWDKSNQRLYVTGKYWPKVFEVSFK